MANCHYSISVPDTNDQKGYVLIWQPSHTRANTHGYVPEHILVAEKVLGKPLPKGVVIHHVDGNRSNNLPFNLVICQDDGYHHLLHWRERALKACGHANWRKCCYCHKYDDRANLKICNNNGKADARAYHVVCARTYCQKRRITMNGGKNH